MLDLSSEKTYKESVRIFIQNRKNPARTLALHKQNHF